MIGSGFSCIVREALASRFYAPRKCMGLVTRDDFRDLPEGVGAEDRVAVYLPMSYQIGGHTVTVPRSRVRVLDMGLDQAMRFALTAGMSWERPSKGREDRSSDVTNR